MCDPAIKSQKGKAVYKKLKPFSYFRKYVEKARINSALHPAGDLRKISKTLSTVEKYQQLSLSSVCLAINLAFEKDFTQSLWTTKKDRFLLKSIEAVLNHPLRAILMY